AMHAYHDGRGFFPHATYNYIDGTGSTPAPYSGKYDRRCWAHDILAYLEQGNLFALLEAHFATGASALAFPDMCTIIPSLYCTSDPTSPKLITFWGGTGTPTQGFSGNYLVCAGNDYFNKTTAADSANLNGIFYAQSKTRLTDVTDGRSNTAMISEVILSPDT